MGEIRTRTELLADEIAQKIRQKIQKQEYAQGDRLTVRWLCEEFGASETPVKQALNQLVSTGLVVSIPKCGMRVRTFTFQDMKNNWEARLMIEQFCAAAAVDTVRRDEQFISNVRKLLQVTTRLMRNVFRTTQRKISAICPNTTGGFIRKSSNAARMTRS